MVLTSGFTLGLPSYGAPSAVDYLLVGGGGSGASSPNIGSGGGGAGGFLSNTGYAVDTTSSYTVTIGAGGTGVNAGGGNNGVNSSLTNPAQQYSYQFIYTSPANYVATASSSTFNLSLGDWTIEGWFNNTTSNASSRYITFYPASGSPAYGLIGGGGNTFAINTFGSSNVLTSSVSTVLNVWTHVALVSSSGTITLYLNGVATGTSSNSWCPNQNTQILFGGQPAGQNYAYWYEGYISNIRIVMGTAVYTGAFTPPALAPLATSGSASAASYTSTTNVNITFPASNTKFLTAQSSTLVDNSLTNNIVGVTTPTNSTSPIGIVAIGGGTGGNYNGSAYNNAASGGSGGGAAWNGTDSTHPGSALQPTSVYGGLGYAGGNGGYYSGGGGGGAGGVGQTYPAGTYAGGGGAGGAGTSTTFVPNYSISFNGSSQYLTAPSSSAFALSGDFTVEGWIYLTAYPGGAAAAYLTDFRSGSSSNFVFGIYSQNTYTYQGGTQLIGSTTVTLNAWHHWAVVRAGSTVTTYLDGVSQGTISSSFSQAATSTVIGARYTGTQEYFTGYISNLRIVNGTALYTSRFAIPTPPLLAITNTSLLTAQSDTIVDNSTNAFTITATGSPPVSSSTIPTAYYGGGGGGGSSYGAGDPPNAPGGVGGGGTAGGYGGYGNTGDPGASNTGGGGGGSAYSSGYGGNGGSGVAIIRYPNSYTAATLYSGATYTNSGGYRIYTFTTSGSISWQPTLNVDYLVVAGGGGGGGNIGGGGGAGGLRTNTGFSVTLGTTYSVTVGSGGAAGYYFAGCSGAQADGGNGNDSVFSSITSTGGGGGGGNPYQQPQNGHAGGSGGGAASRIDIGGTSTGGAGNTPSTSPSQGNNGGSTASVNGSGGGGGAGAAGGAAAAGSSGAGGNGTASSITGSSITYAGGGGGGGLTGVTVGAGGAGGGGAGGGATNQTGTSGTANTGGGGGSGGGGAGASNSYGGTGGSGVVIVRNATSSTIAAVTTGSPTVTTSGGYTIYTFTSSGTIKWQPVVPLDYLVVAGGGTGAWASGGGGGGLLTGTGYIASPGTTYTVTVGAGGATAPAQGNNSVFDTITAIGGGTGTNGSVSANGGSGGGYSYYGGAGGKGVYPGSSYIDAPRQGYDGGTGIDSGGISFAGGGGGGAGGPGNYAVGTAPTGSGGAGGVGAISTIITAAQATTLGVGQVVSSNVYFAGGGGGTGAYSVGAGGYGGGGAGTNGPANAGAAHTGGGSSGSNTSSSPGGSGVVILRYLDSYAAATSTTGSPTIIVSGGYRIYTWTSSGSITF